MSGARSAGCQPTVSVVVCTFTEVRWGAMVEALESVRAQTRPVEHVVLVVDHNPPLAERARREFPWACVVESEGPPGLAAARNTGVAATETDIVAFLDDDATARQDWIACLLDGYVDDHVLGVGGAVLPRWEATPPAWFPPEFLWVVGCTYRGHRLERGPVRNLIGANMSFRREAFQLAGGFATTIGRTAQQPRGCEETEFCIRASAVVADSVIWFEPAATVDHRVPASRATWRYFARRTYCEGLSKRQVSAAVGATRALAQEKTYVRKALSRGIAQALTSAATGEPGGWGRAAAMTSGVVMAGLGYLAAS